MRQVFLGLLCVAAVDLQHAECRVACQWAGFDSGYFDQTQGACACVDFKPYDSMTKDKRLRLTRKGRD